MPAAVTTADDSRESSAVRVAPLPAAHATSHARAWRWAALALRVILAALAVWALRRELTGLDAGELVSALGAYGWRHGVPAVAATIGSFLTLGAIELLALRHVAATRSVPRRTGVITGIVASALSQSIGVSLLTGAAVRLRAYRRHGLTTVDVACISAFVTLTITLGLLATGAVAFLASSAPLRIWHVALSVQLVGAVLGLLVIAYVVWSVTGTRDAIGRGAWRVMRPSARLAMVQIGLSALDWMLTGSILYLALPSTLAVGYWTALRVYLVAQMAGTLSHVPGGAGVFELLVLALLAPVTPPGSRAAVVASLVMFRVLYYLLPLVAACLVAGVAELRASSRDTRIAHDREVSHVG